MGMEEENKRKQTMLVAGSKKKKRERGFECKMQGLGGGWGMSLREELDTVEAFDV